MKILRPRENVTLIVNLKCLADGDATIWFFFRSTEDHHTSAPTDLTGVTDKTNLYWSGSVWYPLHNSYDPYDSGINTGHAWGPGQNSWTTLSSTAAGFAKANKVVHQTTTEPSTASIHLEKTSDVASNATTNTIVYTFTVTNTGTTPLSNVKVVDSFFGITLTYADLKSGDTHNTGFLDTDETWIFEYTYNVQKTDTDPLTNTATATGESGALIVQDTDVLTVHIINEKPGDGGFEPIPCIDILKIGPSTAKIGEIMTFTYEVTSCNPDVPLSDVTVVDSLGMPVTLDSKTGGDQDEFLEAGETWIYKGFYEVKSSSPTEIINIATASGQGGDPVTSTSDFDDHTTHVSGQVTRVPQTGPRFVGGIIIPANKLAILVPYLTVIGLVGVVASSAVVMRRRRER
jgi:hypothetical protein